MVMAAPPWTGSWSGQPPIGPAEQPMADAMHLAQPPRPCSVSQPITAPLHLWKSESPLGIKPGRKSLTQTEGICFGDEGTEMQQGLKRQTVKAALAGKVREEGAHCPSWRQVRGEHKGQIPHLPLLEPGPGASTLPHSRTACWSRFSPHLVSFLRHLRRHILQVP